MSGLPAVMHHIRSPAGNTVGTKGVEIATPGERLEHSVFILTGTAEDEITSHCRNSLRQTAQIQFPCGLMRVIDNRGFYTSRSIAFGYRRLMDSGRVAPSEYQIAGEYRRCAVYCLLGALGIVILTSVLQTPRDGRPLASVMFASSVVLVLGAFRWRIRVDQNGVWWRRLIGWKHWPWAAFESGEIEKALGERAYIRRSEPWWSRKLGFDFLDEEAKGQIIEILDTHWRSPKPAEIPDALEIGWRLFSKLSFAPDGIRVGKKSAAQIYRWDDVISVRIERPDHSRSDFKRMRIVLPDRTLDFGVARHNGVTTTSWSAATAEVLAGIVLRYAAPERVTIISHTGPPKSEEEAMARVEIAREILKDSKGGIIICSLMLLFQIVLMISIAISIRSWTSRLIWIATTSLVVIAGIVLIRYLQRLLGQKLEKAQAQLAEFRGATTDDAPAAQRTSRKSAAPSPSGNSSIPPTPMPSRSAPPAAGSSRRG